MVDSQGRPVKLFRRNELAVQRIHGLYEVVEAPGKSLRVDFTVDPNNCLSGKPTELLSPVEQPIVAALDLEHQSRFGGDAELIAVVRGATVDEVAYVYLFGFQGYSVLKFRSSAQLSLSPTRGGRRWSLPPNPLTECHRRMRG